MSDHEWPWVTMDDTQMSKKIFFGGPTPGPMISVVDRESRVKISFWCYFANIFDQIQEFKIFYDARFYGSYDNS